ncbi:uncharacterized protein PGTG_17869 [Puccinia graminis f. sp. tritici CRL 75-36-700-3]|uniref:Uncharacterized protein n=1 Tax=Puccinia graminis f. sp. tritici (strain CRL 75-36-700-3 / race SCCL) TaxID=418459 RepID=E3L6G4_PUCGT|nr:uncharacterized protein PGTG_17869 [Puccinia graminis f. sp. tritici CRL 75-36-700-3]EFP92139.1 hypothetical protein PGTG_17869 [Puccinia graminis f. sp. tritici CRL 75-36-700-3]
MQHSSCKKLIDSQKLEDRLPNVPDFLRTICRPSWDVQSPNFFPQKSLGVDPPKPQTSKTPRVFGSRSPNSDSSLARPLCSRLGVGTPKTTADRSRHSNSAPRHRHKTAQPAGSRPSKTGCAAGSGRSQ